jgi:hypothetical protein
VVSTVYVDDLDPTFRKFGPGWQQGSTGHASHHFYAPVQKSKRVRYASWKPVLPVAGTYVIQARVPQEHATTRKASYRIKTANGWVTRNRNQYYNRNKWMPLGTHSLTRTPIIQLADKTGESSSTGRKLAFDAIRLIPTAATTAKISALEGSTATARDRRPTQRSTPPSTATPRAPQRNTERSDPAERPDAAPSPVPTESRAADQPADRGADDQ